MRHISSEQRKKNQARSREKYPRFKSDPEWRLRRRKIKRKNYLKWLSNPLVIARKQEQKQDRELKKQRESIEKQRKLQFDREEKQKQKLLKLEQRKELKRIDFEKKCRFREEKKKKMSLGSIRRNMSRSIRSALKVQDIVKKDRTIKFLGCTISFLSQYIEDQFLPGMSWENHGAWHIDHIRPCASFNLKEENEQMKCFHFSNLQPLWAIDNVAKGSTWLGKRFRYEESSRQIR
jgi:hypothetical protein